MNKIELLGPEKMWFSTEGPENDCVISSRVRLSRNLADHNFNGKMLEKESRNVQDQIERAVEICNGDVLGIDSVSIGDLSNVQRRILMERNIIPQEYTLEKRRKVLLGRGKNVYGTINHVDHLRLCAFTSGLDLNKGYSEVNGVEETLEKGLDYAVSLDLGYLSTELTNLGTGMKVSTMMHLPALAEAGLAEKTCKAIVQIGLGVKGFWGEDNHSLGNMYQIANTVSFGVSEKELIEKLENVTYQIVHYERRVREELAEKKRTEIEDTIFRAYGILQYCRTISAKEAIELLLLIRWGVVLGWLNAPISVVTKLLFLSQTAHIQAFLEAEGREISAQSVDYYRAEMIRKKLTGEGIQ
jgi:protein arginine kinase